MQFAMQPLLPHCLRMMAAGSGTLLATLLAAWIGGPAPVLAQATAPAKPAALGKANLLITFPTGSAELTPETLRVLQTLGKALQSDRLAGFVFRIEGHADPRGTVESNIKLSEERAQTVAA